MSKLERSSTGLLLAVNKRLCSELTDEPRVTKRLDFTATVLLLTTVVSQSAFGFYITLSQKGPSVPADGICWVKLAQRWHEFMADCTVLASFGDVAALLKNVSF